MYIKIVSLKPVFKEDFRRHTFYNSGLFNSSDLYTLYNQYTLFYNITISDFYK